MRVTAWYRGIGLHGRQTIPGRWKAALRGTWTALTDIGIQTKRILQGGESSGARPNQTKRVHRADRDQHDCQPADRDQPDCQPANRDQPGGKEAHGHEVTAMANPTVASPSVTIPTAIGPTAITPIATSPTAITPCAVSPTAMMSRARRLEVAARAESRRDVHERHTAPGLVRPIVDAHRGTSRRGRAASSHVGTAAPATRLTRPPPR